MIRTLALIVLISFGLTGPAEVRAQASAIGFQAKLTGVSDGPHTMTFSLYDVETGGTPLQTVGPQNVTAQGGVVSTSVAFDPVHWTGQPRWIQIATDGGPALTPRVATTSSPLAVNSLLLGGAASISFVPGETQLRVVPKDAQSPVEIGLGSPDLGSTQLVIGTTSVSGGDSVIQSVKRNGSEWGVLKLCPDGGYVETFAPLVSRCSSALEFAFGDYTPEETKPNWTGGIPADFFRVSGCGYEPGAGFGVAVGDQIASTVAWLYGPFDRSSFQVRMVTQYLGSPVQDHTSQALLAVFPSQSIFYNHVSVPVLTIRGGSDLAESFTVTPSGVSDRTSSPSPGMVMSIDPANPGALRVATDAYDTRVAGVFSGANGLPTGMIMGKEGCDLTAPGADKVPLAMTGRVWVYADESNGVITPGDRLTTSGLKPGHAMRATDSERSDGAVIGKAMTGVDPDTGMVMVLVNLQ